MIGRHIAKCLKKRVVEPASGLNLWPQATQSLRSKLVARAKINDGQEVEF